MHDLDICFPDHLFAILNMLPQLLLAVVGVLARRADGFGLGELLLSVLCQEVVFDVDKLALLVDPARVNTDQEIEAGLLTI